jgi:hypothetical protein
LAVVLAAGFAAANDGGEKPAAVPLKPAVLEPTLPESPSRPVVDGRWIGCAAASHWQLSEVLRTRSRTLLHLYRNQGDDERCAARAMATFLQQQAVRQEDVGAANGLRAYYARIAVSEQLAIVEQSHNLLEREIGRQQRLLEQGIAGGVDVSQLQREQIGILDRQIQLQAEDEQLRRLLKELTQLDYACCEVLQESLEVLPSLLDCNQLLDLAIRQRSDLRAWEVLVESVSPTTAEEFAKVLPTLAGGWTLPLPSLSHFQRLLGGLDVACLAADIRRELRLGMQIQRDAVQRDVAGKCAKLELAYRRIELAEQIVVSWRERIEQLERMSAMGSSLPSQRAEAESESLQAMSSTISRRLEARLAEVDLAEAMGGLTARCCHGHAWLQTSQIVNH